MTKLDTITAGQLDMLADRFGVNVILALAGGTVGLGKRSQPGLCTAWASAPFTDRAGKAWELPAYLLQVGECYALLWTNSDGAGVCDVALLELADDASDQVREYAQRVAADFCSLPRRPRPPFVSLFTGDREVDPSDWLKRHRFPSPVVSEQLLQDMRARDTDVSDES
jgi:hypothetical protein